MSVQPLYEPPRFIAIEGPIRVGKTSLADLLAERLNALRLRDVEDNPFLGSFYKEEAGAALQAQLYFLLKRFKQSQALDLSANAHRLVVADYLFEKDKIFAYLTLRDDELKLYENLLTAIEKTIPPPDLVIYLQSSVDRLMENIRKRGREMEKNMSEEYIKELNEAYNYFFFRYKSTPLLIVKATDIDFVNNPDHFEDLLTQILRPNKAPVEYYNPLVQK